MLVTKDQLSNAFLALSDDRNESSDVRNDSVMLRTFSRNIVDFYLKGLFKSFAEFLLDSVPQLVTNILHCTGMHYFRRFPS